MSKVVLTLSGCIGILGLETISKKIDNFQENECFSIYNTKLVNSYTLLVQQFASKDAFPSKIVAYRALKIL